MAALQLRPLGGVGWGHQLHSSHRVMLGARSIDGGCGARKRAAPASAHAQGLSAGTKDASRAGQPLVLGVGGAGVDYLASVEEYPKPDDKIRSTEFQVQGGGNVGNCLTAISRLGLRTRIITKLAKDNLGQQILEDLEGEGVDTSHVIVSPTGVSPFTYIIVDKKTKTRTCIHTPGQPPLAADGELSPEAVRAALEGVGLLYLDGRLPAAAILVAREAAARGVPVLVDAERPREGLDDLLAHAMYVVASAAFPRAWTGAATDGVALLRMAQRLPRAQMLAVTLGARGAAVLERAPLERNGDAGVGEEGAAVEGAEEILERLWGEAAASRGNGLPAVFSSQAGLLAAEPAVRGRLLVCTALGLQAEEVVDTTGAGDAFIGALITGLCTGVPLEKALPLAATVAGAKCQSLGARPGLPFKKDSRLQQFLH